MISTGRWSRLAAARSPGRIPSLDRTGAFRPRQLALEIVRTGFVQDALVTFVWAPLDLRPSHVSIVCEGEALPAALVARRVRPVDPSSRATWADRELAIRFHMRYHYLPTVPYAVPPSRRSTMKSSRALLANARKNPLRLRFPELGMLAECFGWQFDRPRYRRTPLDRGTL